MPNDDLIVAQWLPSIPANEQLAQFEPTMREMVSKAKPGQWLMLNFNYGKRYEWGKQVLDMFNQSIKQEWLEQLSPNNPVVVKDGFIHPVVNKLSYEAVRAVHPTLPPTPIGYNYVSPGEGPHGFMTARWYFDGQSGGNIAYLGR